MVGGPERAGSPLSAPSDPDFNFYTVGSEFEAVKAEIAGMSGVVGGPERVGSPLSAPSDPDFSFYTVGSEFEAVKAEIAGMSGVAC